MRRGGAGWEANSQAEVWELLVTIEVVTSLSRKRRGGVGGDCELRNAGGEADRWVGAARVG